MGFSAFYDLLALHNKDRESKPYLYRDEGRVSLHFDFTSTQSSMSESDPDRLVLGYTRTMMAALLFNSSPRQIALVGLGGGSLAKYCYRHLPDACIEVAEISPEVIALRDTFMIPEDDARFNIKCCDGAEFMATTTGTYDWIMVDGFDINGQAPSLATRDFYDDCEKSLGEDGVLIVNIHSTDSEHNQLLGVLRQSFPRSVLVIRSEDSSNKIAFAFKNRELLESAADWSDRAIALEACHSLNLKKAARDLQSAISRDKRHL